MQNGREALALIEDSGMSNTHCNPAAIHYLLSMANQPNLPNNRIVCQVSVWYHLQHGFVYRSN